MSFRSQLVVLLAFAAATLALAGCGGSSSDATGGGGANTSTKPATSSSDRAAKASTAASPGGGARAAFIAEADAICEATDTDQEKALEAFTKKHPKAEKKKGGAGRMLVEIGLPPVTKEAEELGDLTPPPGDKGAYEDIVDGIERGIEGVESSPEAVAAGKSKPFASVEKEAAAYGFEACASPL